MIGLFARVWNKITGVNATGSPSHTIEDGSLVASIRVDTFGLIMLPQGTTGSLTKVICWRIDGYPNS